MMNTADAATLHVSYDRQEQEIPLYQENKLVTLAGYSLDFSHAINDLWSVSVYGQRLDITAKQTTPLLAINAKQRGYSANVNYQIDAYTLALTYQVSDFTLTNKEQLDLSQLAQREQFNYFEDIRSQAIEVSLSKDIDFEHYWLTWDVGVVNVEQQAKYVGKLVAQRANNHYFFSDITEQNSESWLLSTRLSCATLWTWQALSFVPMLQVSVNRVIAGDDVYLFNSAYGTSRSGSVRRSTDQLQQPLTGDNALSVGASLTTLITANFYIDVNVSRFFAQSTATNLYAVGFGWEF